MLLRGCARDRGLHWFRLKWHTACSLKGSDQPARANAKMTSPILRFRIVRNKAAEKAKHVHQQSSQPGSNTSIPHGGSSVSVITHAPAVAVHHTSAHHAERATAYSISGILGIPHADSNGNIPKRKREELHSGKPIVTFVRESSVSANPVKWSKVVAKSDYGMTECNCHSLFSNYCNCS